MSIFNRSSSDAALDLEMQNHIALEIDENLARGMSPDEARRQLISSSDLRAASAKTSGHATASLRSKTFSATCAMLSAPCAAAPVIR